MIATAAAAMTPDQIAAIHDCLQHIAGMDLDRAKELNGIGFSKADSYLGHDLAFMPALSPRHAVLGRALVQRYRRQLGGSTLAIALGRESLL